MELKGKKIAFLGDSITYGVGASDESHNFVEIIKRSCELEEAYNYGIGGTRIAKQIQLNDGEESDQNFCSRVEGMEKDVDAVVVFGGTNDYCHGDAAFGTFADKTPDTFYGACHTLMTSLIEKYPSKPIVFITPLHRVDEGGSFWRWVAKNISLKQYVHAIKEVAEWYSIPVLDLYASGGMQPNVQAQNELYFADGLHPNDTGYALIAEKLEKFLKLL